MDGLWNVALLMLARREKHIFQHVPVDRGEAIYAQGDPADFVYILVSGWVGLHQDLADGRRHIGKFLLQGALFGLEPKGISHCQGATALTAGAICSIPMARFDEMRRENPQFNECVLLMLERENHMATEALTAMGRGTAIERVARVFCELATRLTEAVAAARRSRSRCR